MKIYDISWPISPDITAYKDKKTVIFEQSKSFEKDAVRETTITLGAHTGTHIDAPSHFIKDGKTIDQLDLANVIGPCKVFDMSDISDAITQDHIKNLAIHAGDIVLFKTKNSAAKPNSAFNANFIYLAFSGAQCLVERKVRTVGIDYLGIERGQQGHLTHRILFEHAITIIEGLRLTTVNKGSYFLYCLPLNLIGLEAAPARAILIENE